MTFGLSSPCICRRRVSGSGIPGVGVAPGFIFRFANLGSGIPGVGVAPFGRAVTPFAEIPGVVFADGGIGDMENSGGMFALFVETAFTLTFTLVCGAVPHAKIKQEIASKINSENILYIKTRPQNLNLK